VLESPPGLSDRAIHPNGKQVKIITTEMSFVDSALRGWKSNLERTDKLFGALSPEQLGKEVAPGKNRLIYLWGHPAAVNDSLLLLLGIGERLHPEFDVMFLTNPDKSIQLTVSGQSLKGAWQEINHDHAYGAPNKDQLVYMLVCQKCGRTLGEWVSTEQREKELREFAKRVELLT
jgi:hypothetical protein